MLYLSKISYLRISVNPGPDLYKFFLWVGHDERKKQVNDPNHILDTKIPNFPRSHFHSQCIFNDFVFLIDITQKLMNRS